MGLIDKNSHVHVLIEKSKPEKMVPSPTVTQALDAMELHQSYSCNV